MLAPNLNGDEILSAARCFFPWRLMRWQLGPPNAHAELGKRKATAETKTRIAKKEKYNGRLQQSH
jgi:hypothetical protein